MPGSGRHLSRLTRVLNGHVRHQEVLFGGGVFAVVTFKGLVTGMRQLVVQQELLVVTSVIAKLTLKPCAIKINKQTNKQTKPRGLCTVHICQNVNLICIRCK